MKRLLTLVILILHFTGLSLADEINLLDPKYRWRSPNPETRIEFTDSMLIVSSKKTSSGIYNRLPLNLSTEKYDLLKIELKTSKTGQGEISWISGKQKFSKARSFPFYLKSPNTYHAYYLNLKPYNPSQTIDRILFFPFSGPGRAEIKTLKFIKGSWGEKIMAAWQEFWGPRERGRLGESFLVIKSPRIFGRSIFYYLNLLILICAVLLFLIKNTGYTLFLILILWGILEVNTLTNNWVLFQHNLPFWGKSLEEKRAMQNVKDFYKFIKFAEKIIPADSSFEILTHPKYPYTQARAGYYLYPRKMAENAPYLLIFDAELDRLILTNYKVIEKFRKGAYILKRKKANAL